MWKTDTDACVCVCLCVYMHKWCLLREEEILDGWKESKSKRKHER